MSLAGEKGAAFAVESALRFGRVRRSVWLALVAALLVAVALPGLSLWHSASVALAARGCVWPPEPRVGQPASLYIVLDNTTDRAAASGPWSHAVAQWDMTTMTMGTQRSEVSGTRDDVYRFAIPLQLNMAGRWWIKVTLSTPGRPAWTDTLNVDVLAAGADTSPAAQATQPTTTDPCDPASGTSGASGSGDTST